MTSLKSRVEKLEDMVAGGPIYTEYQWDGILLYFLVTVLPESLIREREAIEKSGAYQWGKEWGVKRQEEMRHWPDAKFEKQRAYRFRLSEEELNAGIQLRIAKALKRHVPSIWGAGNATEEAPACESEWPSDRNQVLVKM